MSNGQKAALWAAAVALGLYIFSRYIIAYLTPFVVALVIAALIEPQVDWLEQHTKVGRGWATLFTLLFFVFLVALFLVLGISNLYYELQDLLRTLPNYQQNISQTLQKWFGEVQFLYSRLPEPVISALEASPDLLYRQVETLAKAIINWVVGLPNFFITLTISFIASFFMTRDHHLLRKELIGMLPRGWREPAVQVGRDVFAAVLGFIRSQLILITISGGVSFIGLLILKVRYALLLALLVAILDLLPLIGPSAFYLPWAGYHLLMGNYSFAISLLLLLATGFLIRQLAEPRIVGSQLGLHPLATLIGIYLGYRLFGAFGLFLGPVLVITFKAIARGFIVPLFSKS
jgi:sporulation integral membrane protein YtvI